MTGLDRAGFVSRLAGQAGCVLIAEIGINHNGDMDLAARMVAAAAAAGADVAKFQNYRTEDFLSDETLSLTYEQAGQTVTEPQWRLFKRCELGPGQLEFLAERCAAEGIAFASTPTNAAGVAALAALGVPFLKNGSDYLGHLPLIADMARTGLPTILSTGMATEDEVADAVDAYRAAGGRDLVLMHCVSTYPAPAEALNLRRMLSLASAFQCGVGFSDHSEGIDAAVAAVAMGARVIEKHFTLDRALPGPDHRFSADPAEFRALAGAVRRTERMLGSAGIAPSATEAEGRAQYRLSCVAARDIACGHRLREADVAMRRPGNGLPPKALPTIVGRTITRDVRAGDPLRASDFA
jgi:N-acetylneuraminate synthase/N,N'-diacetyllegionaminate synthase